MLQLLARATCWLGAALLAVMGCSSESDSTPGAEAGGAAGQGGAGGIGGNGALSGTGGTSGEVLTGYTFSAFSPTVSEPDVTVDRLCPDSAAPDMATDKVFIDCALEGANFAPAAPAEQTDLVVMTYNLERGLQLDDQLNAFLNNPNVPIPDVLLASELDRGCSRTGGRNTPRELAAALEMNYVFAVEFVELPRAGGSGGSIDTTCEHGNAIFSKYPLGNVGQLRHTMNKSWYLSPEEREGMNGEPRLGGRILVYGDVLVGNRVLHVSSLHYESDPSDNEFTVAQAVETAELGLSWPSLVVHGGDTNAPFYFLDLLNGTGSADLVTQSFFERGYVDAHAPLGIRRPRHPRRIGDRFTVRKRGVLQQPRTLRDGDL